MFWEGSVTLGALISRNLRRRQCVVTRVLRNPVTTPFDLPCPLHHILGGPQRLDQPLPSPCLQGLTSPGEQRAGRTSSPLEHPCIPSGHCRSGLESGTLGPLPFAYTQFPQQCPAHSKHLIYAGGMNTLIRAWWVTLTHPSRGSQLLPLAAPGEGARSLPVWGGRR